MTPAQTVQRARRKLGLSAARFAQLIGLDPKHGGRLVYRWETGETEPGKPTLLLIRWLAWDHRPTLDP